MTRRTGKISTATLPLYVKFLMILAIIQVFILTNYVITEDEVLLLTEEGTNKSVSEYLENRSRARNGNEKKEKNKGKKETVPATKKASNSNNKRSSEIVVSKEKLAENERKLDESADGDVVQNTHRSQSQSQPQSQPDPMEEIAKAQREQKVNKEREVAAQLAAMTKRVNATRIQKEQQAHERQVAEEAQAAAAEQHHQEAQAQAYANQIAEEKRKEIRRQEKREEARLVKEARQLEITEDRHIEEEFVKGCKCVQCKEDEVCGGLWKADRLPTIDHDKDYTPDPHSLKIHIVVSHCKSDLHWMSKFIKGYEHSIVSTHIITKCGAPVHGAPEGATIQELPNVGRCDHTYAYYINNILDEKVKKGEENDSIVFFLKDDMSSKNMHQGSAWNKFDSMVQLASSDNGFACGVPPWDSAYHNYEESCSCSAYHDPNLLTFTIEEYDRNIKGYDDNGVDFMSENYPNLGSFYNHLDSEKALPMPKLVQVCYGGIFAASVNNLKRTDDSIWKMAEESLTRGNNIHEGHYMERLWGHLMSKPLEQYQIDAIKNHANDNYVEQFPFNGLLCKGDC
uniref:Uncharacterized protein n=1 Tax=Chaetoceros debilis TaxID=122233 RepID=A0A7S3QHC4_9STRA